MKLCKREEIKWFRSELNINCEFVCSLSLWYMITKVGIYNLHVLNYNLILQEHLTNANIGLVQV